MDTSSQGWKKISPQAIKEGIESIPCKVLSMEAMLATVNAMCDMLESKIAIKETEVRIKCMCGCPHRFVLNIKGADKQKVKNMLHL